MTPLRLTVHPGTFTICRLAPTAPVPAWATAGPFFAITRTDEELSIVCAATAVPPGIQQECGWRMLKVEGPLDFALTGILAHLATTLADAGISLFALSTYDTDYLLVKADTLDATLTALRIAGHDLDEYA